jgi:hypothetical protein
LIDYATIVVVICTIIVGVAVTGAWSRDTWVRLHLLPLLSQMPP